MCRMRRILLHFNVGERCVGIALEVGKHGGTTYAFFLFVLQGQRAKGKENAVHGVVKAEKALREEDSDVKEKVKKKESTVQKDASAVNPGAWRKGKGKKHAMRVANYLSMMKEQYDEVG